MVALSDPAKVSLIDVDRSGKLGEPLRFKGNEYSCITSVGVVATCSHGANTSAYLDSQFTVCQSLDIISMMMMLMCVVLRGRGTEAHKVSACLPAAFLN